jgi:hypothetical protein
MRRSLVPATLALMLLAGPATAQLLVVPESQPAAPTQPGQRPAATPPTSGTPMLVMPGPQEAPQPPRIDPITPNMTFRIVEGQGVFGLTRWIQASGRFVGNTSQDFETFLRANPQAPGMTLAFDSFGGALGAGLRLGRLIRQNRIDTMVGQTVTRIEGGRAVNTLVTHQVPCHSACSYAIMGGVNRRVPSTSLIGVHQFSQRVDAGGRPIDPGFGMAEFENAQALTAALAVYVQEMGVSAQVLEIAATAPFGRPIRIMTNQEIQQTRLGTPAQVVQAERQPTGWSIDPRQDAPELYRLRTRSDQGGRRIDEEMFVRCGNTADVVPVTYRAIVATLPQGGQPLRIGALRIASDRGQNAVWRREANESQLEAGGVNQSIWINFGVPRGVFATAAQTNRLTLEPAQTRDSNFAAPAEWGDGFAEAFQAFARICEPLIQQRQLAQRQTQQLAPAQQQQQPRQGQGGGPSGTIQPTR